MMDAIFGNSNPPPPNQPAPPTTGLREVYRIKTRGRRGNTCIIQGRVLCGVIRDLRIVRVFGVEEFAIKLGLFTGCNPPIREHFRQQLSLEGADAIAVYADTEIDTKISIDAKLRTEEKL